MYLNRLPAQFRCGTWGGMSNSLPNFNRELVFFLK
jgi:hypothetical protein